MLALLLAPPAHASCAIERAETPDGMRIRVRALEEPVDCRTVTLLSDAPLGVKGWVWTPDERRHRLRDDHLRLLPGGGWEIGAPELVPGGSVDLDVTVPGSTLDIRLAPAPAPALVVTEDHETHALVLDARHPGWGFADPKKATTRVTRTLRFPPGAPAQIVPLPADAAEVDTGGLARVPNGVAVPAGTAEARIAYVVPGAAAQGVRAVGPGSFTLLGPDIEWILATDDAAATLVDGGVRFDAPRGGTVRWRVRSARDVAVIPDVNTFVAGLDWRFARVSLPEPALPTWLRAEICGVPSALCLEDDIDRSAWFDTIVEAVRGLRDGALPGAEPLQPRQLNRAWKSGWVTPVERGLVLQRFLGQERFLAAWVLTGEDADPATLTGFDHLLVTAQVEGETRWADPGCAVCAPGEIGTKWLGRPAIGADLATGATNALDRAKMHTGFAPLPAGATVPRAPGRLDRTLSLVGDRFHARFDATGAAALWLRERLVGVEPAARAGRLADALGMPDAALVEATGLGEAGAPVVIVLDGPRAPEDPFPAPDATPWTGGWGDAP